VVFRKDRSSAALILLGPLKFFDSDAMKMRGKDIWLPHGAAPGSEARTKPSIGELVIVHWQLMRIVYPVTPNSWPLVFLVRASMASECLFDAAIL